MNRFLPALYLTLGALSIAYYFVIGFSSRFGLSISWIWLILGAALIVAGLLSRRPVPMGIRYAWRGLLLAGLIAVLALDALVVSGMNAVPPKGLDYLIVLGARVDPDGPSPALRRRLNAVMACLEDHPDAIIIASGGQGADEPMSEARCIRDELVTRGVDPERIILEDRSTTTAQNMRCSLALMDSADASAGIVTNNYHVWRALRMARKAGMTNAHGIAAEYTGPTLPHYMVREAICIVVDGLLGHL